MKKIILLFLGIILITGCSNKKEQELCNKVDEIDVTSLSKEGKYDELAEILENYYATYCEDTSSEVCKALDDYIKATKSELNFTDCSNLEGDRKYLCESNNKLMVSSKKINVTYKDEEMWAVCNKK